MDILEHLSCSIPTWGNIDPAGFGPAKDKDGLNFDPKSDLGQFYIFPYFKK